MNAAVCRPQFLWTCARTGQRCGPRGSRGTAESGPHPDMFGPQPCAQPVEKKWSANQWTSNRDRPLSPRDSPRVRLSLVMASSRPHPTHGSAPPLRVNASPSALAVRRGRPRHWETQRTVKRTSPGTSGGWRFLRRAPSWPRRCSSSSTPRWSATCNPSHWRDWRWARRSCRQLSQVFVFLTYSTTALTARSLGSWKPERAGRGRRAGPGLFLRPGHRLHRAMERSPCPAPARPARRSPNAGIVACTEMLAGRQITLHSRVPAGFPRRAPAQRQTRPAAALVQFIRVLAARTKNLFAERMPGSRARYGAAHTVCGKRDTHAALGSELAGDCTAGRMCIGVTPVNVRSP